MKYTKKSLAKTIANILDEAIREFSAGATKTTKKIKAKPGRPAKAKATSNKRGRPSKAALARKLVAQLRWARTRVAKGTATDADLELVKLHGSANKPSDPARTGVQPVKRGRGRPRKVTDELPNIVPPMPVEAAPAVTADTLVQPIVSLNS